MAKSLNLKVDTSQDGDSGRAVKEFVSRLESEDVIVACWEHNHILSVSKDFGVSPSKIPDWPSGKDFDTVFIFTIKSGAVAEFEVSAEGFKPKLGLQGDDEEPSN